MISAHKLERVRRVRRCFGLLAVGALASACDAGAIREGVDEPLTQDAASDTLDGEAPKAAKTTLNRANNALARKQAPKVVAIAG